MAKYATRADFQSDMWDKLRSSGEGALGLKLKEKLEERQAEKQQKRELDTKLQQLILQAALKGKQLKPGADLSSIDTSQGIKGVLGPLSNMIEITPQVPNRSITVSQRPYSEMQKAREIAMTPDETYYKAGLATGVGEPVTRKWGGMFPVRVPVTDEKGNPIAGMPKYSSYQLSPQAQEERNAARGVLGSPTRTTERISYKGGASMADEPTAEDRFNELVDQGFSEEEAYLQLRQEGF